jgi:Tfp pilus assembly protein PilX
MPKIKPQKHNVDLSLSSAESALRKSEAQRVHEEIKAYAREMGGTEADIDPLLQASNWDGFSRENWNVLD